MHQEYSQSGSEIKPVTLSDSVYQAMGRIIRAFAEIEDIVGLHLCETASLNEGQLLFLMGRASISDKITKVLALASAKGGELERVTKECFDRSEFRALQRCRNVIAHGFLLGETEAGKIAFRTTSITDMDMTYLGVEVATYEPSAFADFALIAESVLGQMERVLRVDTLRAERRAQALLSHPKAQPIKEPSAKHERQRRPPRPKAKDKPLKKRG